MDGVPKNAFILNCIIAKVTLAEVAPVLPQLHLGVAEVYLEQCTDTEQHPVFTIVRAVSHSCDVFD